MHMHVDALLQLMHEAALAACVHEALPMGDKVQRCKSRL